MDLPVTRWLGGGLSDRSRRLLCGHKQGFDAREDGILQDVRSSQTRPCSISHPDTCHKIAELIVLREAISFRLASVYRYAECLLVRVGFCNG